MPMHPPEKKAEVARFVRTTTLAYGDIAAQTGVASATIRDWKRMEGWTRPPGARRRAVITKAMREAAARLRRLGGTNADIAILMQCHAATVPRTIRAAESQAASAREIGPEQVAALHAALTRAGITRRDLLNLAPQALGIVLAQALSGADPQAARRAVDIGRAILTVSALSDDPAAGVSLHDHQHVPATYEETNALLEELARQHQSFFAGGDVRGVSGDSPAAGEAAFE